MWKRFGLLLVVLLLVSSPIFSVRVEEMTDEELWIELMNLSEQQTTSWKLVESLLIETNKTLGLYNSQLMQYQETLTKASNDLMKTRNDLNMALTLFQTASNEISESMKSLESLEKEARRGKIEGLVWGIVLGVVGGIAAATIF